MLDCFGHQVCELQLSHSFIELLGFGHRSQSFGKDAPLPYKVADHLEAQHASVVIVHDAELPRQPHDTCIHWTYKALVIRQYCIYVIYPLKTQKKKGTSCV